MIRLTEEKSVKQNLIDLNNSLIVMKEAEVKDEEFFKSIYDKTLNDFLMRRYIKSFCYTLDQIKEQSKQYDEHINDPLISEQEKEMYLYFKDFFIKSETLRYERAMKYPYDEEKCTKFFEEAFADNLKYSKGLPGNITDLIADLRVFALGYASKQVKTQLNRYCKTLP